MSVVNDSAEVGSEGKDIRTSFLAADPGPESSKLA